MNIKTKYNIGDKVMVRADKMIIKECPFCEGKGFRYVEQEKLYCQNCDQGKLKTRSSESEYVKATIKNINIEIQRKEDIDTDMFEDYPQDYTHLEDDKYATIEYYVMLDDEENYWGYGTYNQNKIKEIGEI